MLKKIIKQKKAKVKIISRVMLLICAILLLVVSTGCQETAPPATATATPDETEPPVVPTLTLTPDETIPVTSVPDQTAQPQNEENEEQAECVDGMSKGTYPCQNVDLRAFMPLDELGEANDIWGWTDPQDGKEYAIMGRTTGTSFVEISQPEFPLGDLPAHNGEASESRDIKVYNNHAFIVSQAAGHGMQVFDLTQLRNPPESFSETAHYDEFGNADNIVINEDSGFAYVVGAIEDEDNQNCNGGLHMINIQNPTSPTFAGCFSDDGYTSDAQCVNYHGPDSEHEDKEICFAANEDTLTIVDVSDKSSPVQLSRTTYDGSGYAQQGWLTEDQTYFLLGDKEDENNNGHNSRTYIWELSDLDSPAVIGNHTSSVPAIDHNQYIKGNYVYQANYRAGLRILDLSDIANGNLSEVGYFDIYPADDEPEMDDGAWSVYPFFESGKLIVSGIKQGLFILELNFAEPPSDEPPSDEPPSDEPPIAGDEYEVDNSCDDAKPIPTDGSPQLHSFHDEEDVDWISFDATEGITLAVEITIPPDFMGQLKLTPAIYENCEGRSHETSESAVNNDPSITFPPPTTGTYYLKIENDSDLHGQDVTYNLSVHPLEDAETFNSLGDEYEANNSCNDANPIPTDGSTQVHTFHNEQDVDWISFDATEGITVAIEISIPDGSMAQLKPEFYEGCDIRSHEGSDASVNTDLRMIVNPPTTGIYHLKLVNDGEVYGEDIAYQLSVHLLQDGSLSENSLPDVQEVEVSLSESQGEIRAKVVEGQEQVTQVWALVYPPSYESESEEDELGDEPEQVELSSDDNNEYGVDYTFDETGEYRVVVYANDTQGQESNRKEVFVRTAYQLYLPAIMRSIE